MKHYLFAVAAWGALTVAAPFVPAAVADQNPSTPAETPEMIQWDLKRLNKEPFNLIRATPDPQAAQVRLVLEFTRPPTPTELYDWERAGGPAVFRFLDEDGVPIRTVKPQLEGELVPQKGARMRLLLPMPDLRILALTHKIVAE
jgi:hypothetical protein